MKTFSFDERRTLIIPGDEEATLDFAANHWLESAAKAIDDHGFFAVALSGGSTPKKIYQRLTSPSNYGRIDWKKVLLFWSDERMVPPTDPESNYHMAMVEGGLERLPLLKDHIFRMEGEKDPEQAAELYEKQIREKLHLRPFDLVMLGMGEDGHTASLFPHTEALHMVNRLVAPNFVPQKNTWRLTFTFECINRATEKVLYVIGKGKREMIAKVLTSPYLPDDLPSQRVGTTKQKALFLLDEEASQNLLSSLK